MRRAIVLPVLALLSCRSDEARPPEPPADDPPFALPAEACTPPDVEAPRNFSPCSSGSGAFGRWTTDDLGLPAYDYAIDEAKEPFALYPTTDGVEHREHWHQIGNRRVTAIFLNEGWIQLGTQDRGPTWLNAFDAEQKAYGGGFSWIDDGREKWSTAYAFRTKPSVVGRRFGTTYAETTMRHGDVEVVRRVFAPAGDAGALVDEVTLRNVGAAAKSLRHYEYWDVARRQIRTSWLASGVAAPTVPGNLVRSRDALNRYFDETSSWDAAQKLLRVARAPSAEGKSKLPAPEAVSDIDARPGDPYLVALVGDVAEAWTDQAAFFGAGDARLPDAVKARGKGAIGAPANGEGQPFAFVLASDVALAPGASRTLRFAYGYSPMGSAPTIDARWRDPAVDLRKEATDAVRDRLVYFASDREPWLQREMAWHAATIQSSVCVRDYWGRHVVPQGSAYLWLHGADGAARDQALFSLPLTYVDPELAREQLLFLMGLTHQKNARMSYAFQGHGVLDDALIHTAPSDLYLFFLAAMHEYLEATGDASVLDELAPFHPKESETASGYEHVRRGVRHLFDTVGVGPHGLVRVQTGDWSDGIVASEAKNRDLALKEGESIPNTQMAVWILPRAARWIRPRDAALADEMVAKAGALAKALEGEWLGDHYRRAWLGGDQKYDGTTLEAQVWALIAQLPDDARRKTLIDTIESKLARTPIGPAMFAGSPDSGDVWPAIADLLPWGYAQSGREDLAWKTFTQVTLHAHAKAFPEMWAGVWSAADGHFAARGGKAPGAAWASVVTPMVDWPVHNNNAHTMPLFALIRLAGVEPIEGGLRVSPRIPGRTFSLETRLVKLDVRPKSIRLEYRAVADGRRVLDVDLGAYVARATLDGAPITVDPGATMVRVDTPTVKGKTVVLVVES
ncbi:MAG: hypothetical protein HYV09_36800 [Deltaproteobacteria bacterium]|nr:hypothetical protein [Deltaproteobacteria bacterium]